MGLIGYGWVRMARADQSMGLSGRKLADIISALIRVQKLSMPGTGGEPAGSLFYPEERRVLALYRNACAHGERLFSHRCHVEILNTALHAKLGIEKIGPDYACGKVDVFSAVIALRYLLRDDEFKAFKAKLVKCVNGYLSSDESIGEERLLEAMGFPAEWSMLDAKLGPARIGRQFLELFSTGMALLGTAYRWQDVRFSEVRVKSKYLRAQLDFWQQNRRSRKRETGAWSADLGISPHFRNRKTEVCGKFRNPRVHRPFRAKKPQVEALPDYRMVSKSEFCRILPS